MPIGFRDAHAGVRNAELRMMQARAILREQEFQVLNNLTGAVDQVGRAFLVLQTSINRTIAAKDQVKALKAAYEADKAELFVVLDAHRRYTEALSAYFQARVDYALAIRNVQFEKGTLLEYCDVALAEGPWPMKAYGDAAQRERLRGKSRRIDFALRRPPIVSQGAASQQTVPNAPAGGGSQSVSVKPPTVRPNAGALQRLAPAPEPPAPPESPLLPTDHPPAFPQTGDFPTVDPAAAIRGDQIQPVSWQSPLDAPR